MRKNNSKEGRNLVEKSLSRRDDGVGQLKQEVIGHLIEINMLIFFVDFLWMVARFWTFGCLVTFFCERGALCMGRKKA